MPQGGWFLGYQCPVCGKRDENPEPISVKDLAARVGTMSKMYVLGSDADRALLDGGPCPDCEAEEATPNT